MQKVDSKIIDAVGHSGDTLTVRFKGGYEYAYWPVSVVEFQELLNAPSIGSYFSKNIRSVKEYERTDDGRDKEDE